MDQKKLQDLAVKLVVEVKDAAKELSRVKGFNLSGLQGLVRTVPLVIQKVESAGAVVGLSGKDKQSLAVEVLLEVVPLPVFLPKVVVRAYLPMLIDVVVDALKTKFNG